MENEQQCVQTDETSTEPQPTEKAQSTCGEHQLEQTSDDREKEDESSEDSKHDKETSNYESDVKIPSASNSQSSTKSALAKKEERLRRLRELHLRRVCTQVPLNFVNRIITMSV